MDLQLQIFTSFDAIPDYWNQYLPAMHDLCKEQIAHIESAKIKDTENYYVAAFEQSNLQCLAYFQVLRIRHSHFSFKQKCLANVGIYAAISCMRPTLLVAGNLYRHDTQNVYFVNQKLDIKDQSILFEKIIKQLLKETKTTAVFIKDFDKQLSLYFTNNQQYLPLQNDISMYLEIPAQWTTMSDYVAALKHKYAQRYRKIVNTFSTIRIQEFTEPEIIKHAPSITQLYLQVTKHQTISMGIINQDFFIQLKKIKGSSYKIFGFFEGNKLIAFSSAIIHDEVYDMNYIGFDYESNNQYNIYFNLLFHCLEQAIYTRSKKLILGRTALDAKAVLGCTPQYLFGFYYVKNKWLHKIALQGAKNFEDTLGEKWKERHPFKPVK